MKTKLIMMGLLATTLWLPAQVITSSYTNSTSAGIPDGSPVGLMEQFSVSGLGGSITNVQVSLDITGGFNGDLYAYLAGPQGQFAMLLNRAGITVSNPYGYGDAGFNITLDGLTASNIHEYGSGYSVNGFGQVLGTWGADGRNIDPQSLGSVFDSASTAANLGVFQDTTGNGLWTFFIADLSGGGTATLNNVILTIVTVPEPQTWAISLFGGVALLVRYSCSRRSQN